MMVVTIRCCTTSVDRFDSKSRKLIKVLVRKPKSMTQPFSGRTSVILWNAGICLMEETEIHM